MNAKTAAEELKKMQRELRRLKFQLPVLERGFCAALERICQMLLKRMEELSPKARAK